jgi:prophage maintenance system killer protein
VTVRYPSLEDYLHAAAFVLDLPVETIVKAVRLDLAESALHAPQATWGGVEFYPSFSMKAAVLLVRLTKNHALPDGNKRTALAVTIAFCDVNGFDWPPRPGTTRTAKRPTSSCSQSPQRPARIWKPSKPRSRPGSPSGCTSASKAR